MTEKKTDQRLPYRLREQFLTTPEISLYRTLMELMGKRYVICPKVSLDDIIYIVRPNENVHFFNKIFRKHVDFLLCNPATLTPAFGVEIIRSNSKEVERESDKFIQDLFTAAGLPLAQIPSREHYDVADVIKRFQSAAAVIGGTAPLRVAKLTDTIPNCPVCGKMMVLRIHRNGASGGKKYYGCMNSPTCQGIVAID